MKNLAVASMMLVFGSGASLAEDSVATGKQAPVLVELFTSQGCYSCPPADTVLGELAARDDVLALGFHVTYWDRLGWPDTLGLQSSTDRQYWYRGRIQSRGVYTPQMVIAGQHDMVGSYRDDVLRGVDAVPALAKTEPIELSIDGDALMINLTRKSGDDAAKMYVALFDKHHMVDILRGENGGKVLDYHHVVRHFSTVSDWRDGSPALAIDLSKIGYESSQGVAVFIQRPEDGAVLAAGQLRPWKDLES